MVPEEDVEGVLPARFLLSGPVDARLDLPGRGRLPMAALVLVPRAAELAVRRAELAEAVRALGPAGSTTQEVWRLMYVEDRPVTEVAGLLGVPEGTVKSRANRVRQLMRAVLVQPLRDGGGR